MIDSSWAFGRVFVCLPVILPRRRCLLAVIWSLALLSGHTALHAHRATPSTCSAEHTPAMTWLALAASAAASFSPPPPPPHRRRRRRRHGCLSYAFGIFDFATLQTAVNMQWCLRPRLRCQQTRTTVCWPAVCAVCVFLHFFLFLFAPADWILIWRVIELLLQQ